MKLWKHKYDWADNDEWALPDGEEMMLRQLEIALDEQVNDVMNIFKRYHRPSFIAVQAGSAFGLYPLALATHFERVITFEPLDENVMAMANNFLREPELSSRIMHYGRALWSEPDVTFYMRYPKDKLNSYGAHCISQKVRGQKIDTMCIDQLKLQDVDLIWLDIEGAELHALKGACHTISANRPIIVVEDRSLTQMREYGTVKGQAVTWVCQAWDYTVVGKTHADVIMVPKEWT